MPVREVLISRYPTPCGTLLLGALYDRLCLCDWELRPHRRRIDRRVQQALRARFVAGRSLTHLLAESQLDEYFAGERSAFSVPLLQVGTQFQRMVWNQLMFQPYGSTLSYAGLAEQAGCPTAVRAVASAVGANALSLFIPCHRIVSSSGAPGGYAGGAEAKYYLLQFEAYMRKHSSFRADLPDQAD